MQLQGIGARAAINRSFRRPVIDRVIAGAQRDDVRAAVTIDPVIARTARQRIRPA